MEYSIKIFLILILFQFQLKTIMRFFDDILEARPNIFSTYNGDSFDWLVCKEFVNWLFSMEIIIFMY